MAFILLNFFSYVNGNSAMERRSFERITTSISARYFYDNMFYTGSILNLSEKGLFISTKRCLPADSMFVIIIRLEEKYLKLVAKVRRLAHGNGYYNGMGVEILTTSVSYLNFIRELKVSV